MVDRDLQFGDLTLLLAKTVNPTRYAAVRKAFVTLTPGMFPREKRRESLRRVDEMRLQ